MRRIRIIPHNPHAQDETDSVLIKQLTELVGANTDSAAATPPTPGEAFWGMDLAASESTVAMAVGPDIMRDLPLDFGLSGKEAASAMSRFGQAIGRFARGSIVPPQNIPLESQLPFHRQPNPLELQVEIDRDTRTREYVMALTLYVSLAPLRQAGMPQTVSSIVTIPYECIDTMPQGRARMVLVDTPEVIDRVRICVHHLAGMVGIYTIAAAYVRDENSTAYDALLVALREVVRNVVLEEVARIPTNVRYARGI